MSYLVPREIPSDCTKCRWAMCNYPTVYCRLMHKGSDMLMAIKSRPDWCPLIEVPPHGRLIDKDKLRHDLFVNFNGERIPFYDCDNFPTKISYRDLHSILAEQKTVIEAERNGE